MHTIDLLKGQGIPERTTLGGVTIVVAGVLVPCLVTAGMLYEYMHNRATIPILQKAIANEQAKIDKLSAAVELNETLGKNRKLITQRLSEVAGCVDTYLQWSPVLVTLARSMPDDMVLTLLGANRKNVQRMIPDKKTPNKTVTISIPTRTLVLNMNGGGEHNYDNAVKGFRDRLRQSTSLGSKLEEIVISQESGRLDGEGTVCYRVNCIFEPKL